MVEVTLEPCRFCEADRVEMETANQEYFWSACGVCMAEGPFKPTAAEAADAHNNCATSAKDKRIAELERALQ